MGNNNIQICIGRQLGSGGHDIGRMLALDFGAKYYDRELLNLAAKESGFSERIFEQNDERKGFFKSLLNVQAPHIGGNVIYRQNFSQESLFQFQSDAIRKAAQQESCVFVGRCADYVLRDHTRLVTIFITAPLEYRIKKLWNAMALRKTQPIRKLSKVKTSVPPIIIIILVRSGVIPPVMTFV